MDTWLIVVGAIGFTLLVMLLGPWMWSSTWTEWRWGRRPKPPPDGGSGTKPRDPAPPTR